MQTAKIKIGDNYAVKRSNMLCRFHVTAIITKRTSSSSDNKIEGHLFDDEDATLGLHSMGPECIEGPFEDFKEQVEKKKKRDEEIRLQALEAKKRRERLRLALYKLAGAKPPKDADGYSQLIRASYSGIEISKEGVDVLLAGLERIIPALNEKTDDADLSPAGPVS